MKPNEARRLARVIIAAAKQGGITLRAFGGAGVMLLNREPPSSAIFRNETDDIDLLGRFEEQYLWQGLFGALNFQLRSGESQFQYEFQGLFEGLEAQVHVYCDPLRFTEVIPEPYFCPEWPETIPPVALLLSKLIIQRAYDQYQQFQDVAAILYEIERQDRSLQLEVAYLERALFSGFAGWRRWLLVGRSLDLAATHLGQLGHGIVESKIRSGIVQLRDVLASPKGDWRWRLARVLHENRVPLMPVYPSDRVEPLSDF